MRNLTLRQLRAVLAVKRLGKISLVAKENGLTAPAVTMQIQQAEAEVGLALFERTRDGMVPTDAGFAIVEAALAVEERLRQLADELAAVTGGRRGSLRLGAVSTAKYFAPSLVAAFKKELPEIDLQLLVGNRAATIDAIENRQVDVALMGHPPRHLPVQAILIGEHPLVIVARPDHPLAGEKRIAKNRIAQEIFVVREHGSGTRISFEQFLGSMPGRLDNLGMEFSSNETIKQAVMAGLGIGFISAHTIAMEVAFGRLVILDVVNTPVRRQWFAVSRADRTASPLMTAFKDFAGRRGRDFLPRVASSDERSA